jgi:hypothetical protein
MTHSENLPGIPNYARLELERRLAQTANLLKDFLFLT